MRLLLDTHLLLWTTARSRRLSAEVRRLVEDGANEVYYSAASIWEIAIKGGLGRRDFHVAIPALLDALARMGFNELSVASAHAECVARLPQVHRDPFDRMLVAQSLVEPLTLLTNDALLARYGPSVRVV